jgi:hypothetical protein
MSDYCVKISAKSDHHALQNLSSNTDAKFARIDNKLVGLKNGGHVSPTNLITFAGTQNGE